jgi:hypothetical protein
MSGTGIHDGPLSAPPCCLADETGGRFLTAVPGVQSGKTIEVAWTGPGNRTDFRG